MDTLYHIEAGHDKEAEDTRAAGALADTPLGLRPAAWPSRHRRTLSEQCNEGIVHNVLQGTATA